MTKMGPGLLAAGFAAIVSGTALALSSIEAEGDVPILTLSARGSQVYDCKAAEGGEPRWVFREPKADLLQNGLPMGRHFAGPTWELADGSSVVGRVAANQKAPGEADIPWLRLSVVSRVGQGALTTATAIQRIDTHGGVLAGACPTAGAVREVPYTAVYVFLRTKT